MSVVRVRTGARPREITSDAVTSGARPPVAPTWVRSSSPTADIARPVAMIRDGRTTRTSRGAICEPTMNPIADGSDHRPGLERRQAEDELEVLGDEEEVADGDEDAHEVDRERAAEGRDAEQAEVDHRVGERQLAPDPDAAEGHADADRADRHRAEAVLGDLLQAEDHREDRDERQHGAGDVEAAGVGVLVLGQHDRSEDQQQGHHRQRQQEHRAPPEVLEHHAAEHRPDRAAGRERRDPDADRDRPLSRVLEHREDQRQRRRRERGAGDAEQGPAADQHLGRRRERREHRDGAERRRRRSGAASAGRSGRRACPSSRGSPRP